MQYEWAIPGTQVICVNDTPKDRHLHEFLLANGFTMVTKGIVYTIRNINDGYDTLALRFEEIHNSVIDYKDGLPPEEPSYDINRFRPVKKTSIDVFTKMVAPVKKEKVLEETH